MVAELILHNTVGSVMKVTSCQPVKAGRNGDTGGTCMMCPFRTACCCLSLQYTSAMVPVGGGAGHTVGGVKCLLLRCCWHVTCACRRLSEPQLLTPCEAEGSAPASARFRHAQPERLIDGMEVAWRES
jgi:hypothetical protein